MGFEFADWPSIGRLVMDWRIIPGLTLDWRIDLGFTYWTRIRLSESSSVETLRSVPYSACSFLLSGGSKLDWHWIGIGLALDWSMIGIGLVNCPVLARDRIDPTLW